VSALVEATARILVREGFDKASTNRIAEVAGVSVGSLYQYFPSKEALVVAVIDRHNQEIVQVVHDELAEAMSLPVQKAVRKMVAAAVKAHRVNPRLHRVLAEQIPRVGKLEDVETFNREYYALFKNYLDKHRDELRVDDLELASFVCVTSIEALTHNAVLRHSKTLSRGAMESLIEAGTRLVVGYLKGWLSDRRLLEVEPCDVARDQADRITQSLEPRPALHGLRRQNLSEKARARPAGE